MLSNKHAPPFLRCSVVVVLVVVFFMVLMTAGVIVVAVVWMHIHHHQSLLFNVHVLLIEIDKISKFSQFKECVSDRPSTKATIHKGDHTQRTDFIKDIVHSENATATLAPLQL